MYVTEVTGKIRPDVVLYTPVEITLVEPWVVTRNPRYPRVHSGSPICSCMFRSYVTSGGYPGDEVEEKGPDKDWSDSLGF